MAVGDDDTLLQVFEEEEREKKDEGASMTDETDGGEDGDYSDESTTNTDSDNDDGLDGLLESEEDDSDMSDDDGDNIVAQRLSRQRPVVVDSDIGSSDDDDDDNDDDGDGEEDENDGGRRKVRLEDCEETSEDDEDGDVLGDSSSSDGSDEPANDNFIVDDEIKLIERKYVPVDDDDNDDGDDDENDDGDDDEDDDSELADESEDGDVTAEPEVQDDDKGLGFGLDDDLGEVDESFIASLESFFVKKDKQGALALLRTRRIKQASDVLEQSLPFIVNYPYTLTFLCQYLQVCAKCHARVCSCSPAASTKIAHRSLSQCFLTSMSGNDVGLSKKLLDHGANVNIENGDALIIAIQHSNHGANLTMVRMLLDRGISIRSDAIDEGIDTKSQAMVDLLLESRAPIRTAHLSHPMVKNFTRRCPSTRLNLVSPRQ